MDVKSLAKRSATVGIGLVALYKERAGKLLKDAEKKGKISTSEAKSIYRKIVREGEAQRKRVERIIKKEIEAAASKAGLATKKDIERHHKKKSAKKRPAKKRSAKRKSVKKAAKKKRR